MGGLATRCQWEVFSMRSAEKIFVSTRESTEPLPNPYRSATHGRGVGPQTTKIAFWINALGRQNDRTGTFYNMLAGHD